MPNTQLEEMIEEQRVVVFDPFLKDTQLPVSPLVRIERFDAAMRRAYKAGAEAMAGLLIEELPDEHEDDKDYKFNNGYNYARAEQQKRNEEFLKTL